MPRCTRRGRCRISRCTSTSSSATTWIRRRSRSTSPICCADEIAKLANWSAQLPAGGDGFLSLAQIAAGTDLLAHPLGTLTFQQKLVPFELQLDKASGSEISGANEFGGGALVVTPHAQDGAPVDRTAPRRR